MEKVHSALRKSCHQRKQPPTKVVCEMGEAKVQLPKTPTKDQCCQTESGHDCCDGNTAATLPGPKAPGAVPMEHRCDVSAVNPVEPGDPPLLQQQLQTSKSGIQQIIECFRSGTAQLKHILLREVDTIFECKLCRSLFRGLPNLITHKEFYCFPSMLDVHDPPPDNPQSRALKELLEAIYPRMDQPEYVVRLEPIETNENAVFQFLSREDVQEPPGERTCSEGIEATGDPPADSPMGEEPTQPEAESPGEPRAGPECEAPEASPQREEQGRAGEEEGEEEEEEANSGGVDGVRISCCLCSKEFNSRRAVRRHCRKAHESKVEELRKFTETRTVPISLLSMVKRRPRRAFSSTGRSCPMCQKSFATKANVRRHFDEVHRGLRRDFITPDIASKPGQPLSLEATPTGHARRQKARAEYNLSACLCLLCKRKYSSQVMLKRHMRIVHKIHALDGGPAPGSSGAAAASVHLKAEAADSDNCEAGAPAANSSPSGGGEVDKKPAGTKNKTKKEGDGPKGRKSKLSVGFDFKQLYCKLCKRQFTSRHNLTKHIALHTDGNDIYIKFYCCPLCGYESRRKRDVIRHVTVVHKKSSRYLAKIVPTLESRVVKKPAEMVLNSAGRRGPQKEDVNGRHDATPGTHKQDSPAGSSSSRKHDSSAGSPGSRRQDAPEGGSEVKFTNSFVLHTCDVCGRAFAKKLYLESHKRSHRTNSALGSAEHGRAKGRSTRSKALLW